MVSVIDYKERKKDDGESFFVLELQGGIEMVKSKETGNFYATAKKAFIPSTFDEHTCMNLIGSQMPGQIIKEQCKPYNYVIEKTGEEITLHHTWVHAPEDVPAEQQKTPVATEKLEPNIEQFSENGVLEHA